MPETPSPASRQGPRVGAGDRRADRTPLPFASGRHRAPLLIGLLLLTVLEHVVGHLIIDRVRRHADALVRRDRRRARSPAAGGHGQPALAMPHIDHGKAEVVADLGLLGAVRIPLARISSVEVFRPSALDPAAPGARVSGAPPRAGFSRGGDGHVLLHLSEPVLARFLFVRRQPAENVLLQSADPRAAVAASRSALGRRTGRGSRGGR